MTTQTNDRQGSGASVTTPVAGVPGRVPILEVSHLSMHYVSKTETVRAVEDVTFSIGQGETFGLVGESGCGKSTTARTLIRLIPETGRIVSGSITYKGRDVAKMGPRDLRGVRGREIGMIFQDPMTSLNPVTPVSKQLYETLRMQGMSKRQMHDRAVELLRLVGIPEPEARLSTYVHELSGGMRQRVMIAIALAGNPKLLLADEPTTALDVTIQNQIICLLNDLRQRLGMSILLVTHDLGVVNEMCDHVAVMYAGHIVETADTRGLLHEPHHPYTLGLIRSLPSERDTRTRLEPIPGMPPNLSREIVGCPFAPRCPFATKACRAVLPEMDPVPGKPGHTVRCHHADRDDRTRVTSEAAQAWLAGQGLSAERDEPAVTVSGGVA